MKKVLLLGGTGFVGRHVCEKLARLQCRGTVATRRRRHAQPLQMLPLTDVVETDAHDRLSAQPLLAVKDAVVRQLAYLNHMYQKTGVIMPQHA